MYYIGIDLGGTNIAAAVVNEEFKIIGRGKLKTALPRPYQEIVSDMISTAKMAAEDAGILLSDIKSVGVGAPGNINLESGVIEYSNNLDWNNVPVRDMIEKALNVPCFVANDANAAAFGEMLAGAGKGSRNFVAVTLGTGFGCGIIVDSKIYTGYNDAAGEYGHSVIVAHGEPCTCGRRGCCEQYTSATALIRQTREAMEKNKDSLMWRITEGDIHAVDGRLAFDAARQGDKAAQQVLDTYFDYLGITLTNIINIFQPEYLCIGGGICNEGSRLIDPLTNYIKINNYSRNSARNTTLCIAQLGNDAGIIGAAMLHLNIR